MTGAPGRIPSGRLCLERVGQRATSSACSLPPITFRRTSPTPARSPRNSRRDGLVDAMRKRHSYGATDNIILDYRLQTGGNEYLQGDIVKLRGGFKLWVKVVGTAPIRQIDIIRNNKFVHTRQPMEQEVTFTFVDSEVSARARATTTCESFRRTTRWPGRRPSGLRGEFTRGILEHGMSIHRPLRRHLTCASRRLDLCAKRRAATPEYLSHAKFRQRRTAPASFTRGAARPSYYVSYRRSESFRSVTCLWGLAAKAAAYGQRCCGGLEHHHWPG